MKKTCGHVLQTRKREIDETFTLIVLSFTIHFHRSLRITSVLPRRDSGRNNLDGRRKPFWCAYWCRGRSLACSLLLKMVDERQRGISCRTSLSRLPRLLIFTIYCGNDYVSFTWKRWHVRPKTRGAFSHVPIASWHVSPATDHRQRACYFFHKNRELLRLNENRLINIVSVRVTRCRYFFSFYLLFSTW